MNKEEELYTALLIISLGGTFSNAYGLCRLIARKFEIFACVELINALIELEYVTFISKDGVKQFSLSKKGISTLDKKRLDIIEHLKNYFPNEIDFISEL